MVRRFCDMCHTEIKDGWYSINIDYRSACSIHPSALKMDDICEECYSKIYETIGNIKYGNNDECKIVEEVD